MAQSTANRVYQDFEPFFEWAEEEASATLIVMLPGYNKDQLRVEVTSTPTLRIKGERQITRNIWRRFMKEFPIPPYCDTNEISAKINYGLLNVKFSKLITPAKPQEEATVISFPMRPQQPPPRADGPDAPAQEVDQQKSPQNKEKEPISDEKEKNKIEEAAAAANKVVADQKEVRTNGLSETAEATTFKAHEKQGMTQRLKTRVLDFTPSLRPAGDQDVNQGSGCLIPAGLKRPKILMNMIVTILLIVVLGMYLKNVLTSSQGGSKFQEF